MFPAIHADVSANSPTSFAARAHDWRMGAVVYQVFVDRFAPSASLDKKRKLYAAPKRLHSWNETPHASKPVPGIGYPHVYDFWGGDLESIRGRLDYVSSLGADVLYLTPIFRSRSNHKYDTEDYFQVSPEFGTKVDLDALISDVHRRRMRIMLDGVFNHMGDTSPQFLSAKSSTKSPYRSWFTFGKKYPTSYRGWLGIGGLPALRLESPSVERYLWSGSDSVVRHYLREGIDGWRLDVGFDIGPAILSSIRKAAHATKPGSAVVGEVSGYPADWFGSLDGVFNFFSMNVVGQALASGVTGGHMSGGRAGAMLQHAVDDAGIDNLLRSWLLTDNHDTARLADMVPDETSRRIVHALQLTLPGSPVLYYGSELGMKGSGDPENRAPMRWDLVNSNNSELAWVRKLAKFRQAHPALRYGDFKALDTDRLLAFTRTTDRVRDSVMVVVNPTTETVRETVSPRIGRLLSWGVLKDALSGRTVRCITGLCPLEVPPRTVEIFTPDTSQQAGYSEYDRIP